MLAVAREWVASFAQTTIQDWTGADIPVLVFLLGAVVANVLFAYFDIDAVPDADATLRRTAVSDGRFAWLLTSGAGSPRLSSCAGR